MLLTIKNYAAAATSLKRPLRLILISCFLPFLFTSIVLAGQEKEQTEFQTAPDQKITRPAHLPRGVLQLLAKDNEVSDCLADNPIPKSGSLAAWFAASEVHLGGPGEEDLVVLPIADGDRFLCFHSVEGIGFFWVFRKAGKNYQLVLKTGGLGLSVLRTRHNGYRDIESDGQAGVYYTRNIYHFQNGSYREFRQITKKY